jgi:formate hydrogenlyase subunit 3/multisubunit Na+/H+ antiporter MnhD subunit
MGLVLVTILLPIAAAALLLLLPRDDKTLSRVIGTLVAVFTFATVIAAGTGEWSAHWLSRPPSISALRRSLFGWRCS